MKQTKKRNSSNTNGRDEKGEKYLNANNGSKQNNKTKMESEKVKCVYCLKGIKFEEERKWEPFDEDDIGIDKYRNDEEESKITEKGNETKANEKVGSIEKSKSKANNIKTKSEGKSETKAEVKSKGKTNTKSKSKIRKGSDEKEEEDEREEGQGEEGENEEDEEDNKEKANLQKAKLKTNKSKNNENKENKESEENNKEEEEEEEEREEEGEEEEEIEEEEEEEGDKDKQHKKKTKKENPSKATKEPTLMTEVTKNQTPLTKREIQPGKSNNSSSNPQKQQFNIDQIQKNNTNDKSSLKSITKSIPITPQSSKQANPSYTHNNPTPSYFHFQNCSHIICVKCISRLLFTTAGNNIPYTETTSISCACGEGSLTLNHPKIGAISNKSNEPEPEALCPNHGGILIEYCLDCKKSLCKKCRESHNDLFTNHHIAKEEPPNTDTCPDHPNCFLDVYCQDCKRQTCHLCLKEGNKHFGHSAITFDNGKNRILNNISSLKHSDFDSFMKYLSECSATYNNKYEKNIREFNISVETLISFIRKYQRDFNQNMRNKMKEKNTNIDIVTNGYRFVFKEFEKINKSVDYPVLIMYQVFNSELLSFSLQQPEVKSMFINEIQNEIAKIDNSNAFSTNYQFSLKDFNKCFNLTNHSNCINSLTQLYDGRLASASDDKSIIIWDLDLSKPNIIIRDHNSGVKVVNTGIDHRGISGAFKEIKIFNIKKNTYKCALTLKDISNNICAILQGDDGRLISGSYREMRIFNLTWNNSYNDTNSNPVKDHSSWVKSLINLKDKQFASASDDQQIFIYDYEIRCFRVVKCKNEINCLCMMFNESSKDDYDDYYNAFYIGDTNGRIFLYSYVEDKYELISDNDQHHGKVNSIVNIHGGNYASCSSDSLIIFRDNQFAPIQIVNKNDNKGITKSINAILQGRKGKIICGGDDYVLGVFE